MLEEVWDDDDESVGTVDIQILLSWFFETSDEQDDYSARSSKDAA